MTYKRKEISFFPIYKEMADSLLKTSNEQIGEIIRNAIKYAFYEGKGSEESDDVLIEILCGQINNDIERHKESYAEKCEQKRLERHYGIYKQETVKKGETPMSFEEWKDGMKIGEDEQKEKEDKKSGNNSENDETATFKEKQNRVLQMLNG